MKLVNYTPFPWLVFEGRDKNDTPSHVIVLRATLTLDERGLRLAKTQRPLVLSDQHQGAPGSSSTREESDLAPIKPRADVLVRGTAWAPGGKPAPAWEVSVRVGEAAKRLRVTGPRAWVREGDGFRLEEPEPTRWVPLHYELAYGGTVRDGDREERFEENPLGLGFAPAFWRDKQDRIPAPQIEAVDEPLSDIDRPIAPQGFGPVGRAWLPRRLLAGTFDDAWQKTRWPVMPADFDDAYWNCAPPGLTVPGFLRGDEEVHLRGLDPDGDLRFRLPGHYVFALFSYEAGPPVPYPMMLDTLTINVDAREVAMVYRLTAPHAPAIESIEARMDFRDPDGRAEPRPRDAPL